MAAVPRSSLGRLARKKSDEMISAREQNTDNVAKTGKRNYEQSTPPLASKGIATTVTATSSPPRNTQRPLAIWAPWRKKWPLVAATKHSLAGKQCETCSVKTANYGIAKNMFRKQWCKTVASRDERGVSRGTRAAKMLPASQQRSIQAYWRRLSFVQSLAPK